MTKPEEFRAIADFRDSIYREVGRAEAGAPSLAETFHPLRKVYGFRHRGALVAAVTIVVPDDRTYVECIDELRDGGRKARFDRTEIIEVSKLCIAKDHRGTALALEIFELVHAELVASGRARILASSSERLLPYYARIAFERTGDAYRRPVGIPETLHVLHSRQKRWGTYGLHVGPIRWNIYLRRVQEGLIRSGRLRLNPFQSAAFAIYRGFGPLADRVVASYRKSRRP